MAAGEAPLRSPARVVATLALCGVFATSASYAADTRTARKRLSIPGPNPSNREHDHSRGPLCRPG